MSIELDKATLENVRGMLKGLPKTVVADSVRRIMREAGRIVRTSINSTVPVKTGELKRSFKIRSLPRTRNISRIGVRVASYPKEGRRYYASMVEYGWNPGGGTTKKWRAEGTRTGNMRDAHLKSILGRRVPGKFFFEQALDDAQSIVNKTIVVGVSDHIAASVAKYEARAAKRAMKKRGAA